MAVPIKRTGLTINTNRKDQRLQNARSLQTLAAQKQAYDEASAKYLDDQKKYQEYAAAIEKSKIDTENIRANATPFQKVVGTVNDAIVGGTLRGLSRGLEGIVDIGAGLAGSVGGAMGFKDFQNKTKDFIAKDYTQDVIAPFTDKHTYSRYSVLPETKLGYYIRAVQEGIGQMLPAIAIGMATGGASAGASVGATVGSAGSMTAGHAALSAYASTLTFASTAAGNSMQEALNEGASFNDAFTFGLWSGTLEAATEQIIGGTPIVKFGGGALDKTINKITKSPLGRVALSAVGEGFEEVVADGLNPYLKRLIYDKDADLSTASELLDSFIIGSLLSLVTEGKSFVYKHRLNTNSYLLNQYKTQMDMLLEQEQSLAVKQKGVLTADQISRFNEVKAELKTKIETAMEKMGIVEEADQKIKDRIAAAELTYNEYNAQEQAKLNNERMEKQKQKQVPKLSEKNTEIIKDTKIQNDDGTPKLLFESNGVYTAVPIEGKKGVYANAQKPLNLSKKTISKLDAANLKSILGDNKLSRSKIIELITKRDAKTMDALKQMGYDSFIYSDGTVTLYDIFDERNVIGKKIKKETKKAVETEVKKETKEKPEKTDVDQKAASKEKQRQISVIAKATYMVERINKLSGKKYDVKFKKLDPIKNADGTISKPQSMYLNNTIYIDPSSTTALNKLIIHEVTHGLEGSDFYEDYKKHIMDYFKNDPAMKKQMDIIRDHYSKTYDSLGMDKTDFDSVIEHEIVAFQTEHFFGSYNDINNMLTQNKGLFTKLMNHIKFYISLIGMNKKDRDLMMFYRRGQVLFSRALENRLRDEVREQAYRLAYHAGDLGKSESYYNIATARRGTGHFGTGTYFVSDPKLIQGDGYRHRPVESIELDNYSTFKVQSTTEGFQLHDFLRDINYNLYGWGMVEKFAKIDAEKMVENSPAKFIREYGTENEKSWLKQYKDQLYSVKMAAEDIYDRYLTKKKTHNTLIDTANSLFNKDQDPIVYANIYNALFKTLDTLDEYQKYDSYSEKMQVADSLATVFMKALGYEGIDVRGVNLLDNTSYGSVIYDLKGQDLDRKKEIGTAQFKLDVIPDDWNYQSENVLKKAKMDKFKASDVIQYLKNNGVKPEEIRWLGLADLIESNKDEKGNIAKGDVLDLIEQNRVQIQVDMLDNRNGYYLNYINYTAPRGTDHREMLIRYKPRPNRKIFESAHFPDYGLGKNLISHVRFQTMLKSDTQENVIYVDEAQSDWEKAVNGDSANAQNFKTVINNSIKNAIESINGEDLKQYGSFYTNAINSVLELKKKHNDLDGTESVKGFLDAFWKYQKTNFKNLKNEVVAIYEKEKNNDGFKAYFNEVIKDNRKTIENMNIHEIAAFLGLHLQRTYYDNIYATDKFIEAYLKVDFTRDIEVGVSDAMDQWGLDPAKLQIPKPGPFVEKAWNEISMKALIRYIAEQNAINNKNKTDNKISYIALTNGLEQTMRWAKGTAKYDTIKYHPSYSKNGTYNITLESFDGETKEYLGYDVAKDEQNLFTNKKLAAKIMSDNDRAGIIHLPTMSNGFFDLYDYGGKSSFNIPRFLEKYLKQWDIELEPIKITIDGSMRKVIGFKLNDELQKDVTTRGQPLFRLLTETYEDDIAQLQDQGLTISPAFYSKLNSLVFQSKQETFTKDVIKWLENNGVKREEIKWSNIESLFESKKSVTKGEMYKFLKENSVSVKLAEPTMSKKNHYQKYSSDGKGFYREYILTYENNKKRDGSDIVYFNPHFNEVNVLAHTRVSSFTSKLSGIDTISKPYLNDTILIEEIQSDWHQAGKSSGYLNENYDTSDHYKRKEKLRDEFYKLQDEISELDNSINRHLADKYDHLMSGLSGQELLKAMNKIELEYGKEYSKHAKTFIEMQNRLGEIKHELNKLNTLPPMNAPFKKNWHEVVLKATLRKVAEEIYHTKYAKSNDKHTELLKRVVIAPPGVHKKRYGYGAKVAVIESTYERTGVWSVNLYGESNLNDLLRRNGYSNASMSESDIREFFAKYPKVIDRILKVKNHHENTTITIPKGIEVGGDGFDAFYDIDGKSSQNIFRFLEKYLKQWDIKPEKMKYYGFTQLNKDFREIKYYDYEGWGFVMNDQMIDDLMKVGQPLFRLDAEGNKIADVQTEIDKRYDSLRNRARTTYFELQNLLINAQAGIEIVGQGVGFTNVASYTNYVRGATSAGDAMLNQDVGQYDLNGNRVGDGLDQVFDFINQKYGKNSPLKAAYKQAFFDYLVDRHHIDRVAAEKPARGEFFSVEEAQREIADFERQYPEFVRHAEQVYTYNQNLLQMQVDAGLVSQEQADTMRSMYPHYVPLYRAEAPMGTGSLKGGSAIAVSSAIKKAKGSDMDILPIDVQMARQTMKIVKNARLNMLIQQLWMHADFVGDYTHINMISITEATRENLLNISDPDFIEKTNTISYYENGQKITLSLSKPVFDGFKAYQHDPTGLMNSLPIKIIQKMNRTFKYLITSISPFFAVRNAMRDIQDAGIYSKHPSALWARNWTRAIGMIKSNGELWRLYQATGGSFASIFNFDTGTEKKTPKNIFSKALGKMEQVNMMIEQLPRFTEFISSYESGKNLQDSLLDSADITVNFGRSGRFTQQLNNTFVPFLNAAIQGTSKAYRTIVSRKTIGQWGSLIMRTVLLGIAPSVLNKMLYEDDEEWKDLRQFEKEGYYLLKVGKTWIKIPKGRVVAMLSATLQRTDQAIEGDQKAFSGYMKDVAGHVLPVENVGRMFKGGLFAPFVDVQTNTTWYGGEIESARFDNVEPKKRFDEGTSEIAKILGEAINYSPKKIHYLLDQYSGLIGDILLPLTTAKAERNILESNFTIDPTMQNDISRKFADELKEAAYGKTNGDPIAAAKHKYLNRVSSSLKDLYDEISVIQNDKTLTDKEKMKQVETINILINTSRRSALENVNELVKTLGIIGIEMNEEFDNQYRDGIYLSMGAATAMASTNKTIYEKATVLTRGGISYDAYYSAYYSIKDMVGILNEDGNAFPGTKRKQAFAYIDLMNIPKVQKIMLFGSLGYRDKKYQSAIQKYVLSLDLTLDEKAELLKVVGYPLAD